MSRPPAGRSRSRPFRATGALVVGLYAWWVAGLAHFTLPALVAVVGPGAAVLGLAAVRPPRASRPAAPTAGVAYWVALAGLVAGLELWAFVHLPRDDYPTISSVLDAALGPRLLEAAAFALWLGAGWRLARA